MIERVHIGLLWVLECEDKENLIFFSFFINFKTQCNLSREHCLS